MVEISYKILSPSAGLMRVGSGAKYLNSNRQGKVVTAGHVVKDTRVARVQAYQDGKAVGAPVEAKVTEIENSDVAVLTPLTPLLGEAKEIAKQPLQMDETLTGKGGFKGGKLRPNRQARVIDKPTDGTLYLDNDQGFNKGDSGMSFRNEKGQLTAVTSALVETAWHNQLGSGSSPKGRSKVKAYDLTDRRLYQKVMAA